MGIDWRLIDDIWQAPASDDSAGWRVGADGDFLFCGCSLDDFARNPCAIGSLLFETL